MILGAQFVDRTRDAFFRVERDIDLSGFAVLDGLFRLLDTDAAIKGKIDPMMGLKENVIIGKLIPAGSGVSDY